MLIIQCLTAWALYKHQQWLHGIWYRVTQRHLASPLSTRSARSLKLTCLQAWHSAKKWIDGNYAATTLTPNVSQRWLALSELLHQWRWWRGHSQWIIVNVIIVTANVGLMLILTSCYCCNSWNMRNGNGILQWCVLSLNKFHWSLEPQTLLL